MEALELEAAVLGNEGGGFSYVEMCGDIPSARTLTAAAGIDRDKLYVFGGESLETGEVLGDLFEGRVVGSAIEWTKRDSEDAVERDKAHKIGEDGQSIPVSKKSKPLWPAARFGHAACRAIVKGAPKMFLCGGSAASGHAWLYDPETLTWFDAKCSGKSPFPVSKHSLCSLPDGSSAALVGGVMGAGEPSGNVSIIDFETMAWTSLKDAVPPVHSHVAAWLLNPDSVTLSLSTSVASLGTGSEVDGGEGEVVAAPPPKKEKSYWKAGENDEEWCLVVFGGSGSRGEVNLVDRGGVSKVADVGAPYEAGRWGSGVAVVADGKDCVVVGGSFKGARFAEAKR